MRTSKGAGILIVIGLAMAGAGCGAGSTTPAPAPSAPARARTATSAGPTVRDLSSALLGEEDLPGFTVSGDPAAGETPAGCAGLDFDPESGASGHAEVLLKQSELGPFIRERLLRLSPEGAEALVAKVRSAADTCRSFTTHDQMVGTLEFHVSPLDIGALADATAAIRLTGEATDFNLLLYQDLAAVRLGSVAIVISQVSPGSIDTGLTRSATEKALAKLQK